MATQASMAGVRDNGSRWRHRIDLKPMTTQIGALNDRDGEVTRAELEPLVDAIVARVRTFCAGCKDGGMADDIANCADDLEMVSDLDIEEVNEAMGRLYDAFDYWRVLAG